MFEVVRFGKVLGKVLAVSSNEDATKDNAVRKFGKGVSIRRVL